MRLYLFVLFIFFSLTVKSQTQCDCFDRLYNLSMNYSIMGDWHKAAETLKDGISFLNTEQRSGEFYYLLGEAYSHDNKADSAAIYFTLAIKLGYPLNWVKDGYPDIVQKIDPNKLELYAFDLRKKIDFDLYDRFVQALALDQATRNGTLYPENEIYDGTPEKKAFIDTLTERVDSITSEFVNSILDKYGYPSADELGFYPSGIMGLILHITASDNEMSRKLFIKLSKLNEQCNFPQKSTILFLKDRQKYYKERKDCCGLIGSTERYQSIENINEADSIRFLYNQIRLKEEVSGNDSTSIKNRQQLDARGYKPTPYPKNYFCNEKYHFE